MFGDAYKEDNGRPSSMRIHCFIALIVAAYLSIFAEATIEFVLLWLVAAFAPKAVQKFAEQKIS